MTKAFDAAQHSPHAMDMLKSLLVGPLLEPDSEPATVTPAVTGGVTECVTSGVTAADVGSLSSPLADTERSLALLLGLRAAALYRSTAPQPAELQAQAVLETGVFDGGLEVRESAEGDSVQVTVIS